MESPVKLFVPAFVFSAVLRKQPSRFKTHVVTPPFYASSSLP